ncbi:hypothetical protein NHX12_014491, partial [Muraenolepis orangiensis]
DVKLTASNDDYYFVFEDFLYQVLMCFSRDTAILDHFTYNSASPPRSFIPELYSVFREMYVRYFFRLHSISSSPS